MVLFHYTLRGLWYTFVNAIVTALVAETVSGNHNTEVREKA